jgi:hypothetical protein
MKGSAANRAIAFGLFHSQIAGRGADLGRIGQIGAAENRYCEGIVLPN